jgi:hypothetical protein
VPRLGKEVRISRAISIGSDHSQPASVEYLKRGQMSVVDDKSIMDNVKLYRLKGEGGRRQWIKYIFWQG